MDKSFKVFAFKEDGTPLSFDDNFPTMMESGNDFDILNREKGYYKVQAEQKKYFFEIWVNRQFETIIKDGNSLALNGPNKEREFYKFD